jgi:5-methylcytosine-specific restriction endonuclease McrA
MHAPDSTERSPRWPAARAAHLAIEPACVVCGSTANLEVHHILPFHVHPELELDPTNLITLCERAGHECHFVFGHYFDFQAWNPDVRTYAAAFRRAVLTARIAEGVDPTQADAVR